VEKLDELKKAMMDAVEEYKAFMINNSRELKEEEKAKQTSVPYIVGDIENSEERVFVLTIEILDEFRRLEKNMRDTQSAYAKEYIEHHEDNRKI
jgi:chromatin segregation and condensation protein Rec8/ScpA/Scc1 (kleisin family)